MEPTRGTEDLWDYVMSPMEGLVPRSFLLTAMVDSLGCLTQVSLWMNLVMWDTYSPYQPLVLSHTRTVLAGWYSKQHCLGLQYSRVMGVVAGIIYPVPTHNFQGGRMQTSPLLGLSTDSYASL